jgi:hypothetical protein
MAASTLLWGQYFPEQDATWEGATYTLAGPEAYRELLCGQTVINGRAYSQLYSVEGEGDTLRYLAAVRTNGPRVFYVEEGSTEERLLYDFSLETGDSINLQYVGLPGDVTLKVSSVAFVTQGGTTRKVINFVPVMGIQDVWVEGVGSLFGPLRRGFIAVDAYSELFCQRLSGGLSYRTTAADDCSFVYECMPTARRQPPLSTDEAAVFPTVSGGAFQLRYAGTESLEARLFDAMGRCVWQEGGFSKGVHRLWLGHLPKGMYYLTLSTSNKNIYLQRFKLMITR